MFVEKNETKSSYDYTTNLWIARSGCVRWYYVYHVNKYQYNLLFLFLDFMNERHQHIPGISPALLRCSTSKWHNDNSKRQSKKTSSVAYTIDHNDTKMNVNNATESKSPSFFSSCNSMLAFDTKTAHWKAKLSKQCSRNEFSTAHELIRSNSFTEWKTSSYGWMESCLPTVYDIPI